MKLQIGIIFGLILRNAFFFLRIESTVGNSGDVVRPKLKKPGFIFNHSILHQKHLVTICHTEKGYILKFEKILQNNLTIRDTIRDWTILK